METLVILIVNALAAGASAIAGSQTIVNESVQEAYLSLKRLIEHKFEGIPEALLVLSKYEEKPTVWTAPLEEELKQTHAYQDEEIVKTAQKLMILVKQPQSVECADITAIDQRYQRLERYYKESLYRAKKQLYLCLVFAILGFLIILCGVYLLSMKYTFAGLLASIGTIISEIVAFLFFWRAREAGKNIDAYFKNLLEVDKKHWAGRLTMMLNQKPRHLFKEEILQHLLDAS